MIEVGHISQSIYLISSYLGLGVCGLGLGISGDDVGFAMELDDTFESVFYKMSVGLIE